MMCIEHYCGYRFFFSRLHIETDPLSALVKTADKCMLEIREEEEGLSHKVSTTTSRQPSPPCSQQEGLPEGAEGSQ